jgi:DNA-binding transcriptional LysR family regulator
LTAPPELDWNNLCALLALVRGGTLRRASQRHGASPATLMRRVQQLEVTVGAPLVERSPAGSRLTAVGQQVFEQALAMEKLAVSIGRAGQHESADRAQGTVRVNADEWVSLLLTRQMPALHAQHPGLGIEVLTSHRPYSIDRDEADIVVRAHRPASADLVARAVGTLDFGLYGSSGYVRMHAGPLGRAAWGALDYVGFDAQHLDFEAERWLRAWAEPAQPWLRCSYALGIYDGILADAGLGVLAQFVARGDDRLTPVLAAIPALRQRYWLAYHRSARGSLRVRATADFIVQAFARI